jgi:hypothetical protein
MTPASLLLPALLAPALWLSAPAGPQSGPQSGPPSHIPLSNTFISAAQVVLDDASAVEIKGPDDRFDGEMKTLRTAEDNLHAMAYEPREHSVVDAANQLIFAIAACHIQAKDNTPTDKCEAQVDRARNRAMTTLGRHKTGATWTDGPPS